MTSDDAGMVARRKKLFVYASTYDMTREERIDLAEIILRRDIASWKDLTDEQVMRLLDALEGHSVISHMLSQRRA